MAERQLVANSTGACSRNRHCRQIWRASRRKSSPAFTLLATLVAIALSGLLFPSFSTVFRQTQTVIFNLNLSLERDQNLSFLPLLLNR